MLPYDPASSLHYNVSIEGPNINLSAKDRIDEPITAGTAKGASIFSL